MEKVRFDQQTWRGNDFNFCTAYTHLLLAYRFVLHEHNFINHHCLCFCSWVFQYCSNNSGFLLALRLLILYTFAYMYFLFNYLQLSSLSAIILHMPLLFMHMYIYRYENLISQTSKDMSKYPRVEYVVLDHYRELYSN